MRLKYTLTEELKALLKKHSRNGCWVLDGEFVDIKSDLRPGFLCNEAQKCLYEFCSMFDGAEKATRRLKRQIDDAELEVKKTRTY